MRARPRIEVIGLGARSAGSRKPARLQWIDLNKRRLACECIFKERMIRPGRPVYSPALLGKPAICATHANRRGYVQNAVTRFFPDEKCPDEISKCRHRRNVQSSSPCLLFAMRDLSHAYPFRPGAKTAGSFPSLQQTTARQQINFENGPSQPSNSRSNRRHCPP